LLFDIRPKKRKEDLFGREEELNRLACVSTFAEEYKKDYR